ncbi:MAG: type II toxin-antitoxin system HigB family toxin [Cyanobacteriota bacterium]|nr:type II toxin-antitoxin system HigB family toxin [Cyanobacteriota bacterium]
MHVITKSYFNPFWKKHPDSKNRLIDWYKKVDKAQWKNPADLRRTFNSADFVGNFTVFNVGGNSYRLIAFIDYKYKKVFIRSILTHAEYDEETWKTDEWYVE